MVLSAYVFVLFLGSALVQTAHAATEHPTLGAYLSVHGDPPPSMLGLNLSVDYTIFRWTAGVGSYTTALSNFPRGIANYTVMPLGFAFYWLGDVLDQFFSHGKVRTHKDYSQYRLPYENVQSIYSYGTAAKVVPLSGPFSPLVGIGYSRFETSGNPFGLPDSKGFVYFPIGVEFKRNKLIVGLGYNICAAIDQQASGLYLNIGSQF